MSKSLDGNRVRAVLGADTKALLAKYRQFENLVPASDRAGAGHAGEDGRFVEALIRGFLRPLLPTGLEVATGFIMRPAVKTGVNGRERRGDQDSHSSQLDVIVFDSADYPVFQRFEETVVVPPESVVALVSVKKHLRSPDVGSECMALAQAASLCRCLDPGGKPVRGPFLAVTAMSFADPPKSKSVAEKIFEEIEKAHRSDPLPTFEEAVGLVGTVDGESVFKKRPKNKTPDVAEYLWIQHRADEDHWALQLMLTGILSVYYDETRSSRRRPGFSGFQPGRDHDGHLGSIKVKGLR